VPIFIGRYSSWLLVTNNYSRLRQIIMNEFEFGVSSRGLIRALMSVLVLGLERGDRGLCCGDCTLTTASYNWNQACAYEGGRALLLSNGGCSSSVLLQEDIPLFRAPVQKWAPHPYCLFSWTDASAFSLACHRQPKQVEQLAASQRTNLLTCYGS
jgi:hypothetical protein